MNRRCSLSHRIVARPHPAQLEKAASAADARARVGTEISLVSLALLARMIRTLALPLALTLALALAFALALARLRVISPHFGVARLVAVFLLLQLVLLLYLPRIAVP